jgi:outer membrane lipoprotein-sorting protein
VRAGLALILAGALTGAGCASHSIARVAAPAKTPRAASMDEVISAYDAYCRGLETLSATGDLDVKDFRAGKQRKLGVRLLAGRDGRLYVKGSVLLVTGLEVVANAERFWFQVPSKKTVWTGLAEAEPTAEGEAQEPYYALRPRDVTAALLPEPLKPAAGDVLAFESSRGEFCLTLSTRGADAGRATVRRRVCVDRETLQPTSLRRYDSQGELSAEIALADVREGAAHRVSISRPAEGYLAAFSFEKLARNQSLPEKAFVPRTPEGYKVVEVGP